MSNSETTIDTRKFRDVLGRFATGVAIVTAETEGVRLSVTVSSFSSVSLAPPLVLFSIARSALSFELWQRTDHFAVTVLSEEQQEISNRFGRATPDKWNGIDAERGVHGVPLIPGGLACFECDVYARYEGGDHLIIVGRVLEFSADETDPFAKPLVFYGGRYRNLAAPAEV